jgi:hypothetical protein
VHHGVLELLHHICRAGLYEELAEIERELDDDLFLVSTRFYPRRDA